MDLPCNLSWTARDHWELSSDISLDTSEAPGPLSGPAADGAPRKRTLTQGRGIDIGHGIATLLMSLRVPAMTRADAPTGQMQLGAGTKSMVCPPLSDNHSCNDNLSPRTDS